MEIYLLLVFTINYKRRESVKENFKVKINNNIYNILKEDQMNFNIKSFNALVNFIFNNYMLSGIEEDICENVWGALRDKGFSLENVSVVDQVLKDIIYPDTNLNRSGNKAINFRLKGENLDHYAGIDTDWSYSDSIFFRKMFEVYARNPKFKREVVIYHNQIEKLREACKGRKKVIIDTETSSRPLEVYPYSVIPSKDESCNYLLSFDPENEVVYPIKISLIKKCIPTRKNYFLSKEAEQELKERTEKKITTQGRVEKMEIILNSEGYNLYKSVQNNRPHYESIKEFKVEGRAHHRLAFYTTKSSIKFYFLKFGRKCEVVFPESLRDDFVKFYKNSFESYKKRKS